MSLVQIRRSRPLPADAPKVYIETYGCQMNVADSDLMRGLLQDAGYATVPTPDTADVILVNTCAVREKAEEKVFARAAELKVWKRRRPGVILGITGCMAEHLREKVLERAPEVDIVVGPDGYRRLTDLVAQARQNDKETEDPLVDVRLDKRETYEGLDPAVSPGDGAISGFVTIQRGCDKFCTFCVVPLTRGRERGTPPREVLRQVRALVEQGAREVTLLGQTVNSYRHEEARFSDLLRAVARIDGLERVRFTSPYPVDFSDDVIAAIAEEPKIAKHVHMPLQSGSDAVLERMKRGYRYAEFARLLTALRQRVPGIGVTTDLLVGFSGETDAEHAATLSAMDELAFDHAFMFAYSEREGTQAARRLPDDVPAAVKQARLAEIIRKQEHISTKANAAYVGRIEPVLFHAASRRSDAELVGRTSSFKAVIVPRGERAPGDLAPVRITRSSSATLHGELA